MPHIKRNFNRLNHQRTDQIPILKPSHMNKALNQERLKQIYQSSATKQKQKSKQKNGRKYYLPIPNRKLLQQGEDNEPKSSTRYRSYLDGEQALQHNPLLSHRHQSNNQRNVRYEQNNKSRNDNSYQFDQSIRRKAPSLIIGQINAYKRKQSNKNIQNQLNQLNQNLAKNKNSRKFYNLDNGNITSKYRASSNYQQNPYQNQTFKIRRSTKKSLSGSITKKQSEQNVRQDSKLQNHPVTKSQLTSPKNDFLMQGKTYFKNGDFKQALKCFEKGKQTQSKNLNFDYNIALVHLKQQNYEEGLSLLQQIMSTDPVFKKTIYLFAAISLKHLKKLSKAIQFANKGIKVFKNFVDLIFYRAKLYKENDQIQESLKDLQQVISLQKDHVEALYFLSFLYYERQLMTHAMSTLSSAIYYDQDKNSQFRQEALKLRAKLYLAEGKIKQAKRDILKLKIQKSNKNSAQIYYLLGKIQIQESNVSDALINFQKCLRQGSQPNMTQNASSLFPITPPGQYLILSLLEICKTKINIKDFYSAFHHINRAKHFSAQFNQHDDLLLRFKYFIQGVVFLMKRKVDQAMKNFDKFKQIEIKLLQSFSRHNQSGQKLNGQSFLNLKQIQKDIDYFYPMFYLYRAFGYFMQNNHQLSIKDYEQYQKSIALDKYTLYNLLLAKGITKITSQDFQFAINYFNKSEQLFLKSQTKKIEPYIYRAMTSIEQARSFNKLGQLKNNNTNNKNGQSQAQLANRPLQANISDDNDIKVLQLIFQALKQLDKACDLNDSNSNLLFIRSLIYAYLNKFDQSLDDIIKAISKSQENVPKYFFFRGLLQSTLQNKKQAINDFNIAINLDNNYAAIYRERAKLYFQTQNYSKALQDLQKFSELSPQTDIQIHKTSLYLVNGLFPMAEQTIELVKNQTTQNYKQTKFHIYMKLAKLQEAQQFILPQYETDRVLLRIMAGDLTGVVTVKNGQNIITIPQFSKIKFFNIIQYYHMIGVAFFSIGEYQRAVEEFTIALKQCHLRDMQKSASAYTHKKSTNQQHQDQNHNLGQKDINCITYNIFLCHLKLGQLRKAYEVFIRDIMPLNQKIQKNEFMTNFSHLLFQAMKKSNSSSLLKSNDKLAMSTEDKEQAQIQLFANMFTDLFSPQVLIQTPSFYLKTKLCYLNIEFQRLKKQYSAKLYPQNVLTWLKVKQVQNRPQPPWVKRQLSDQCLIFTDQVQNINIEFQTTQHDEEESQDDQQQEDDDDLQDQNYEEDEDQSHHKNYESRDNQNSSQGNSKKKFDPRKFRDQMKLGDSIQRKLNKIVGRNQ